MNYKQASSDLARVGSSHATGDLLAAMYADLVPVACCMGKKTIPAFYKHFRGLDDDKAIHAEFKRLVADPLSCFDIV